MANKERNKRSARKARSQERTDREAALQAVAPDAKDSSTKRAKAIDLPKSSVAKAEKQTSKPKRFARIRNYFSQVRSEMRRVVWPSREELKNYSVAVIAMLIIFGVAVWVVDTGVAAALVGFAGLRG